MAGLAGRASTLLLLVLAGLALPSEANRTPRQSASRRVSPARALVLARAACVANTPGCRECSGSPPRCSACKPTHVLSSAGPCEACAPGFFNNDGVASNGCEYPARNIEASPIANAELVTSCPSSAAKACSGWQGRSYRLTVTAQLFADFGVPIPGGCLRVSTCGAVYQPELGIDAGGDVAPGDVRYTIYDDPTCLSSTPAPFASASGCRNTETGQLLPGVPGAELLLKYPASSGANYTVSLGVPASQTACLTNIVRVTASFDCDLARDPY